MYLPRNCRYTTEAYRIDRVVAVDQNDAGEPSCSQ